VDQAIVDYLLPITECFKQTSDNRFPVATSSDVRCRLWQTNVGFLITVSSVTSAKQTQKQADRQGNRQRIS
jgi:hypothetical protein